jgi:hypothetical protein
MNKLSYPAVASTFKRNALYDAAYFIMSVSFLAAKLALKGSCFHYIMLKDLVS